MFEVGASQDLGLQYFHCQKQKAGFGEVGRSIPSTVCSGRWSCLR